MTKPKYLLAASCIAFASSTYSEASAWEKGVYPDIDRMEKRHVLPQKMIEDMRRGRDEGRWFEEKRREYVFKIVKDGKTQEQLDREQGRVGKVAPMPK